MRGIAIAIGLMLAGPRAGATPTTFDAAMQGVLVEYGKIHGALAGDSVRGVPEGAKAIERLAGKLPRPTGQHAKHLGEIPAKLKAAAAQLSSARALEGAREAFKALSRPMALWATLSRPSGINVVYCAMAKASWLQRDRTISNPYYGPKMLRCGEVVSGKDKGAADGHMKRGGHAL